MIPISPFQQRVYDAVRQIPASRIATYAQVARMIGSRSPRAVGGALRRNPFVPGVPCHRVIGSDLSLTGYFGKSTGQQLAAKRRLLESEGVTFLPGGRVDPCHLMPFP